MDDEEEEEVSLAGGNLTPVVRVGNTVRRTAGPWTPMVHDLLHHIRDRGFEMCPEPLGIDDQNREILSFIEGETITGHPWPRWVWSDELLIEAVDAMAAYHRAVADFRPNTVESRLGAEPLADDEIVCHNDFAPYNGVFRRNSLTALIDWDVVCPGTPAWDLAFVAWQWVPLHAPSPGLEWRTPVDCHRRLRLVVDTYGLGEPSGFVDQIVERIEGSRTGIITRARSGDAVFARLQKDGHADEMARALDFIDSNAALLRTALDD